MRAIRMSLDRPGLFRTQVRALLRAAGGRTLYLMVPMITSVAEMDAARRLIAREQELMVERGTWPAPAAVKIGAMIEVPSLLFELDALMPRIDFVSVGSNDLMQFLFAADRGNSRVANRYDALSVPGLRALRQIVEAGEKHGKPVTLCGELAGRPLSAMALIGLGFRSISMSPASIGPVKAMLRSLDASRIAERMTEWLGTKTGSLRSDLHSFAEGDSIEL